MTSLERIVAAMELRTPDKVPVCPRLDPVWLRNAGDDVASEIIRTTDLVFYVDLLPDHVLYFGEGARGRHQSRTENGRRHETLESPKGVLTRVVRLESDMMDWDEEHPFKTVADVERALSIPYSPPLLDLSGYRYWERRIGQEGMVMAHVRNALCCPGLWFGPEEFLLQACCSDTDTVRRLLERVNRSVLDVVRQCLDAGVRFFMMSGAELASQTVMGPQWFSSLVSPYDEPVARMIRAAGGYTWCHCHGKIARIHRRLAALGAHVLSPCEKPPQGDIGLRELKASIGREICLAGNLDDLGLISTGDRDRIREETLTVLHDGMPGGGFLLGGTEGGVFSRRNAEGYLYMCELRDRFGVYPG